jgi:hypothetical protein
MLILLILICLLLIFLDYKYWEEGIGYVFGGILGVIFILILLISIGFLVNGRTLDTQLEMYNTENSRIEKSISYTVEKYMKHEENIYKEISPENILLVANTYPEINSNALIQKELELYIANNEKIKSLKHEKISLSNVKWWVYFGG